MNVFEARYGGYCICCEERIHVGERVHYVDDQLVHEGCDIVPDRDPDRPRRTERRCADCFTIHAGECA